MLVTQLKDKAQIQSLADEHTFAIVCEGCKEVYSPQGEVEDVICDLSVASLVTEYICNAEHMLIQLGDYAEALKTASSILVFSCGIGVQTIADTFPEKRVFAACDTFPLPGSQGVTPTEHDCEECGECYLNETCGICPITSCSKSILNGQCGGAKNGMCEVDKEMECGWELIYKRLSERGIAPKTVFMRDYTK